MHVVCKSKDTPPPPFRAGGLDLSAILGDDLKDIKFEDLLPRD
jgi:hypothetical protein